MSSHALVQSALDAHAGLTALVGQRIRPDLADPADDMPFVVFKRTRLERHKGLEGTLLGTTETFDIECWAATRAESINVAEQAALALDAAQLDATEGQPDGIDPEFLDRVTVLSVSI